MKKRIMSILLCLVMTMGLIPTAALAADNDEFPYQYKADNGETITKISHPLVAPNANGTDKRTNDGVVDYAGNGKITAPIGSDADPGARGESYSWSALAHGDWVYTCLLYNAMGSTIDQMKGGLGYDFDRETMNAALNVLYNGDFYIGEEDGGNPGGALVKINVKTGAVVVLMSESAQQGEYRHSVFFRNAVEYKGKFYFCGSVDSTPQIWQVDPETDKCKMVYGMEMKDFISGYRQGISSGIRGLCVYNDELIISCVMKNETTGEIEPQICSSKDPETTGFTVIATQEDLLDYPAYHFADSIYGGSIWEIVEFNDKLYVSICTGTPDNMPEKNTMQSFAIVRGEKSAEGTWSWTPVVGDTADGAQYTFGIDPERTCSGAGVLTVYDGYLYIAEYNDEEIALINVIFNLDLEFMNKNLEQSVNLYRMDENENIELVVGSETEMFPEGGKSGLGSGFGHNENQYIWRMTVHDGKLYCGTFDTSSLLEPIGQFSNGDLTTWTSNQWNKLFGYIRALLELTYDKNSEYNNDAAEQTREDIRELFELFTQLGEERAPLAIDGENSNAEDLEDIGLTMLADLFSDLPEEFFDEYNNDELDEEISSEIAAAFDDGMSAEAIALNDEDVGGDGFDDNNTVYDWTDVLKFMKELVQIAKKVAVTAQYMADADRGCDIYVSEDGINFDTITTDGFGDPFNHGLRVYAETSSGLAFGTANPFYGTQWWYVEDTEPSEYKITFDGNGGTPSEASMTTVGQKLTSLPNATRSGNYSFDGWYTEKSGGDKITTSYEFFDSVTVYAHWTYTGSSGGHSSGSTAYTITVEDSRNGAVTADRKTASAGTTVTLTVKPDQGWTLETLTATNSNGKEIDLNIVKVGEKYTFKMPASNVTVTATFMEDNTILNYFVDVPTNSYYYDAVLWAVENGITKGTDDSHFDPNGICTRAQAVTFLWRAAGSPAPKSTAMPFTDVPAGSYYYNAVLWAVENGITKGTTDTTFSPSMNCTRAQIVTFLWRSENSPAAGTVNPFTDIKSGAYYADAVLWAVKEDVTKGTTDTTFSPSDNCTRAQIVTFIYRALAE